MLLNHRVATGRVWLRATVTPYLQGYSSIFKPHGHQFHVGNQDNTHSEIPTENTLTWIALDGASKTGPTHLDLLPRADFFFLPTVDEFAHKMYSLKHHQPNTCIKWPPNSKAQGAFAAGQPSPICLLVSVMGISVRYFDGVQ